MHAECVKNRKRKYFNSGCTSFDITAMQSNQMRFIHRNKENITTPTRDGEVGRGDWRKYNLRMRPHNLTLLPKDDRNFIARQLYKNIY